MVSQPVSQNTKKSTKSTNFNFEACLAKCSNLKCKTESSDRTEKGPGCETYESQFTFQSKSTQPDSVTLEVTDPDTPTSSNHSQASSRAVRKIDTFSTRSNGLPNASAAEIPNSSEEVSAMPAKGNGCIFKSKTKSGSIVWKVEVTIGTGPGGKRIRTRRTAHSYSEAREIHRQLLSELNRGDLRTKSSETFGSYSLWWLRSVKSLRVRPSTLTDYESRLMTLIAPHFAHRRMDEITARDIDNWLFAMRNKGHATTTINGARQVLGAVFKHAVKSGILTKNPVEFTERVRKSNHEKSQVQRPWSLEEAKHVLLASRDTEFDLFVRLSLLLGARRGEVLGLRWCDVDFDSGYLEINGSLREQRVLNAAGAGSVELVRGETKTKTSNRRLYIAGEVLAALHRQRSKSHEWASAEGKHLTNSGYIFTTSSGQPVHPSNYAKRFQKFLREHGIRHIRIHDMRHTAAVMALESGVRLEAVSQALGHSRIDITKSVYAPYVQPLITEFARATAEYLAPIQPLHINQTTKQEALNA